MLKDSYSFEELKMSSQLVRDLVAESEKVRPFINRFFDFNAIIDQINEKNFSEEKRKVLYKVLNEQNKDVQLSVQTKCHIESLQSENTFTITTGHQLNLMTGPLYSIYKAVQVIKIANQLKEIHPTYNFVPVFWMATEDHDFEEISKIHLFGKAVQWEKEGQENLVTGRISTAQIEPFLSEIEGFFQDPKAQEVLKNFTDIYRNTSNLTEATRQLMNELLGDYGLVILDGDDPELKSFFAEHMILEVENQIGFETVQKSDEELESKGYHQQVFVRECNLFYIHKDGVRERIALNEDRFEFDGQSYSKDDLVELIRKQPAQFSPNALYRPLYQEVILPNLVYVGGGGEIAYWCQLKAMFEKHNVVFPMLRLRDSAILYNQPQVDLLNELDISLFDLKLGVEHLIKDIAIENADADLQLTEAESLLMKSKSAVLEKVYKVNEGLAQMVEAEFAKMVNSIEKIESKIIKAEKAKHEKVQKQLVRVRDNFYPENSFQERYDNFLPYYLKNDQLIKDIYTNLKVEKTPLIQLINI
ncbi:bacillithiol biosynthesis cysteine-adding enzyme BshC [Paracrocinitomix mangrovi]|uniref:bacillithiol biosynthesis cysteine-adding enzyme BshC n=1 Tax=Paracrocinitomix mangrovi TaxID=2862509 RepID=UPI001C8CF546|nr:bacillithiol biosynthesis cysteine-adding enzyme BshC [Paracrocinitomix mangrovi]UKN02874.1 bacillithiol biosynthesis cysteine-adding enzyme BshC [Paracrocinitomix mangrovi]